MVFMEFSSCLDFHLTRECYVEKFYAENTFKGRVLSSVFTVRMSLFAHGF